MSSNPSVAENQNPQTQPETSNFRRMAAVLVGAGVLSAAACVDQVRATNGGDGQNGDGSALVVTPADGLADDLAARAALTDDITDGGDIDELRKKLADSDEANPTVRELQARLVDLEDVEDVLYEDPETAMPKLADIADPALKQRAEEMVGGKAIDEAISIVEYGDPQLAVDAITELPESLQAKAQTRLQAKLAERASRIASFDPVGARNLCGFISDPVVQGKLLHLVELSEQLDKLFDDYNYDIDDYYSLKNQIYAAEDEVSLSLPADESSEDELDSTDIMMEQVDAEDEIARQTTIDIRAHNDMEATAYTGQTLPPLEDPKALIDLTDATSDKQFEEVLRGETYQEFGQVYIEDGKLKFKLQDGLKVSKQSKMAMFDAIQHAQPLLEAAFASGDVSVVRWVLSSSYDPYYSSVSHEIVMVLPTDDSTTVDQLASGIVHETAHSLTRSAYNMEQVTVDEANSISNACTAVKDATFNRVEQSLGIYPELLQGLLDQAKPEHKAVIQTIITAVTDGSFEQLMLDPTAEYAEGSEYAAVLNNCADLTFGNAIVAAAEVSGVDITDDALSYLFKTDQYAEFADQWDLTLSYASIYELMNESNFTDTDYIDKDLLGHSQENAAEMIASFMDAVLSYAPELKEVMQADMDEQGRAATIQAIRTSVDLIIARHPSLSGLMSAVEADIVSAIGSY